MTDYLQYDAKRKALLKRKAFIKKLANSVITAVVVILGLIMAYFPMYYSLAKEIEYVAEPQIVAVEPTPVLIEVHKKIQASVSAYTSSADETDSNPFENAMGTRPQHGSMACPREYKLGTTVYIGERRFVCDDRMNIRYNDGKHFDIWVEDKATAYAWGRQSIEVSVVIEK